MLQLRRQAMTADVLSMVVVFTIAFLGRNSWAPDQRSTLRAIVTCLVCISVWVFALATHGCYRRQYLGTGFEEAKRVTNATFVAGMGMATLGYILKSETSRLLLLSTVLAGLIAILSSRRMLHIKLLKDREAGKYLHNTLILGSESYAQQFQELVQDQPSVGFKVCTSIPVLTSPEPASVQPWINFIVRIVEEQKIDTIVIEDSANATPAAIGELSWHLNSLAVDLLVAPSFFQLVGPRLEIRPHHELSLLHLDEPYLTMSERFTKRSLDLMMSTIAIVLALPFALLIAVGIFVSNPGPIFFIQDRVGQAGKNFKFLKFRSMVVGAEALRAEVLGRPDDEMAERYRNDPRIFPFGKFLRRFSLDELPQLLSVFTGKMSIVGPRPILLEELDLLDTQDHRRHLTKPGLTGLWQINGRKETTWDERIQLDLEYVHDWSIGLDVAIILKTIRVIISGQGSY